MIEKEWLSPNVLSARLAHFAPSTFIVEWLRDPAHGERLAAPLRDILRALARVLTEAEVVAFIDRTLQRGLREVPLDAAAGRWLLPVLASPQTAAAFETLALSLAHIAERPDAAATVRTWVERAARALRQGGKRWVPLLLRRPIVQRKSLKRPVHTPRSSCATPLLSRTTHCVEPSSTCLERFATGLANGDTTTLGYVEQLRQALLESLDARPIIVLC